LAILNQALGGAASEFGGATPTTAAAGAGAAAPAAAANTPHFSINKTAGIVSVFGTSRQQKLVQDYLSKIVSEASSQVLIEAKVVEVDLNDQFKAGIDWQKALTLGHGNTFNIGTNATVGSTSSTGAGFLTDQTNFAKDALSAATQNPFSIAWTGRDFSSLLQFVEGFGTTRTLSSPRITVLNNQTAVLKVAQNQVYFSLTATITPSTVAGVASTATYTSTLHTVPIGVVMTVQPVIDLDKELVTMSLRPTVSVHNGDVSDPAVALALAAACTSSAGTSNTGPCSASSISTATSNSNVPIVEVREMDSVVTMPSGDIVVMGGLMQSVNQKQETGVPGAADIPFLGNLFKAQTHETDVTELVIFLKASIVHGSDSIEWADKDLYKRYMQDPRPLAF
jgi:general secretion pathway protein D